MWKKFRLRKQHDTSERPNLNPLSPNSGENEISLYIITTCSNIQVMRIREVITKEFPQEMHEGSIREINNSHV